MKKVVLLGAGGHAKCVIDAIRAGREYEPACALDPSVVEGGTVLGVKIVGPDSALPRLARGGLSLAFVALGSTGDPKKRAALWKLAEDLGLDFPNIIHPSAMVSPNATLGRGIYVGAGAIVNAGAVIEDGCIINSGAIVEHDCRLGLFVHIAPG
ncbi:MAG TPA: hypothetical protein PK523_13265, partial [Elusimicrobiales bacterium]|nr:hypothetical protein [Elusimicrobiales bacterium]